MARNYPRFLFSNVIKGKSTGAFITHTLKPQMLIKVKKNESDEDDIPPLFYSSGSIMLVPVDVWDDAATEAQKFKVLEDAHRWIFGQFILGEIEL